MYERVDGAVGVVSDELVDHPGGLARAVEGGPLDLGPEEAVHVAGEAVAHPHPTGHIQPVRHQQGDAVVSRLPDGGFEVSH